MKIFPASTLVFTVAVVFSRTTCIEAYGRNSYASCSKRGEIKCAEDSRNFYQRCTGRYYAWRRLPKDYSCIAGGSTTGGDVIGKEVSVTIKNLSRGQPFSPPMVATHNSAQGPVYEFGEAASDELRAIAEDGNAIPLHDLYAASANVGSAVVLDGPIGPLQETTVNVLITTEFPMLTIASMAVNTNDCFVSLNAQQILGEGRLVLLRPGLDAGTEVNDEDCANIPGPACAAKPGNGRIAENSVIHVHAGVHTLRDLVPSDVDWRNPMVQFIIE